MAEALKDFFSPSLIRRLAADIRRVHPQFSEKAFVRRATTGLQELELLDRARHIKFALVETLPPSYPEAVSILVRSLGPEHATDELLGVGMAPFFYMPHVLFVGEHGLDHFDLSLDAQYELTKRFSAESSIRAYIARDPERTFERFERWVRDPSPHVRRLVSEGSRLRLPWAQRVAWLDEHPARVLEMLELLKDDPATVVRRSLANNLNDLGKVWPDLLIRTCEAWLVDATPERRVLIEHALRSAVKRGLPDALRLLGFGEKAAVSIERVTFDPPRVPIGQRVRLSFVLRSRSSSTQDLLVDVAVHFVKVRGTGRKVFKLKRVKLGPRARVAMATTLSMAIHTTRKPRPGTHLVEVMVNGQPHSAGVFEVLAARKGR